MIRVLAQILVVLVACDDSNPVKEGAPRDRGGPLVDSGLDGGGPANDGAAPADCVMNPTTHAEIINACTTATKITKNPVLPKLLPDGGLPPLQ